MLPDGGTPWSDEFTLVISLMLESCSCSISDTPRFSAFCVMISGFAPVGSGSYTIQPPTSTACRANSSIVMFLGMDRFGIIFSPLMDELIYMSLSVMRRFT